MVVSKTHNRARNANVRSSAGQYLGMVGVTAVPLNSGEYLVVDTGETGKVRFHPSTGTWSLSNGTKMRGGVKAFAKYILSKVNKP